MKWQVRVGAQARLSGGGIYTMPSKEAPSRSGAHVSHAK